MKPNGVRRVRIVRGALELDVELDPAAQFLGSEPPTADDGAAEKLAEEKRGKGLCVSSGCEKTGGHMGQPYCRAHFLAEVNGAQTT